MFFFISVEKLNLAEGKTAYQSSVWRENDIPYDANLAVDNSTSNENQKGDCAQTGTTPNKNW